MGTMSKYQQMKIVTSQSEAWNILYSLRPDEALPARSLDDNDRRYAQALVLEAAEASARMGMIQELWSKAVNPATTPSSIARTAAKIIVKYMANQNQPWQKQVNSPRYIAVMNQIARVQRSIWTVRMQTEDSSGLLD